MLLSISLILLVGADDFCDEIYAGGISFCVREGGKLCYLVSR